MRDVQHTGRGLFVPRAAGRVLTACATAPLLWPELQLDDSTAGAAFERLGGACTQFGLEELRCTAVRALVLDTLARSYFERTQSATGVGICSMLGTRAHRLADFPWTDVDPPEIANLRRFALPQRDGWTQAEADFRDTGWLKAIRHCSGHRTLIVLDESLLPICAHSLGRLLDDLSSWARAGSEFLLALDGHVSVRCSTRGGPGCLELALREGLARYPRLLFVDPGTYAAPIANAMRSIDRDAVHDVNAPAIVHLRFA